MLGLYTIDEHGDVVPCADTLEWAQWFETHPIRQVAVTRLDNGIRVSTIFLGLDHGYGGRPLLFETMIFFGDTSLDQFRYPDWTRAAAHHLELVAQYRERTAFE